MKSLTNLPFKPGKIEWIGVRPKRKGELISVKEVDITIEEGLTGDHYKGKNKKRQITLIQKEHLGVVASLLLQSDIDPKLTRRNVVVSGINLSAFSGMKFRLGSAVLEHTGPCHPCSRMEKNLGKGGYHAMRGHGGITARVVEDGIANVGDSVVLITELS